ncbi:putative motility protein [Candidatus Symbiobacter mobilis]|uniref:Motility protein n=1 Tax=Candidatus Symbiobacter mobilis CR TaxID=946483 RepID=U5N801_9BURK|nr:putative motility protein [Candidatus Symbiobacter mobilis]AGX87686.1 hypothetical protein Cenrod_1601 [Candidatus Symbiobacter mobilis CR]
MNITNTAAVRTATTAAQSSTSDALHMLVLRKALDAESNAAAAMLQTLPQPAPSNNNTNMGTVVNTYA